MVLNIVVLIKKKSGSDILPLKHKKFCSILEHCTAVLHLYLIINITIDEVNFVTQQL